MEVVRIRQLMYLCGQDCKIIMLGSWVETIQPPDFALANHFIPVSSSLFLFLSPSVSLILACFAYSFCFAAS